MLYLQIEHLLKIHSFVVDETGGLHGIRERGRLESAVARPKQVAFGQELYPTVFTKAAVYCHAIIFDHPFLDGNKRTAMTAAFVFLENNGYDSTAVEGEIEKFALSVITKRHDVTAIAAWLKEHSKKRTRF